MLPHHRSTAKRLLHTLLRILLLLHTLLRILLLHILLLLHIVLLLLLLLILLLLLLLLLLVDKVCNLVMDRKARLQLRLLVQR